MDTLVLVTNDQKCWKTESCELDGLTPLWGSVICCFLFCYLLWTLLAIWQIRPLIGRHIIVWLLYYLFRGCCQEAPGSIYSCSGLAEESGAYNVSLIQRWLTQRYISFCSIHHSGHFPQLQHRQLQQPADSFWAGADLNWEASCASRNRSWPGSIFFKSGDRAEDWGTGGGARRKIGRVGASRTWHWEKWSSSGPAFDLWPHSLCDCSSFIWTQKFTFVKLYIWRNRQYSNFRN